MKFDLIELINGKKDKIEVHTIIEKDKLILGEEEVKYSSPITLNGVFRKKSEQYIFKGSFSTSLVFTCSRCIEEFIKEVTFDVEEVFSKYPNEEERIIENSTIDLYSIIEQNLVLNLPVKTLCTESCKGLCPSCGTNLNNSSCNCILEDEELEEEPLLDPRFAKLKNLLNDNK